VRIVQLVPALHKGDAIGNNALAIRNLFCSLGEDAEIQYLEADPDIAYEGRPVLLEDKGADKSTVWIMHYALPSALDGFFREVSGRKIIVYHNITPSEYLTGYPQFQQLARAGRESLRALRDVPDIAVADSEFNRRELESMGFAATREIPIYLDLETYRTSSNPVIEEIFRNDYVNILYVGRITPNKCHHDLIRFYGFYKRFVRSRSRLFLVGKWGGFERYQHQLSLMAEDLKLGDIHFTGRVSHGELMTYYSLADVFVSMSEHEGFGVPLVEAMLFKLPVLAYSAAAVPGTMGGAGVLFHDKKHFIELAELLEMIHTEPELREKIIQAQIQRLKGFAPEKVGAIWRKVVGGISG